MHGKGAPFHEIRGNVLITSESDWVDTSTILIYNFLILCLFPCYQLQLIYGYFRNHLLQLDCYLIRIWRRNVKNERYRLLEVGDDSVRLFIARTSCFSKPFFYSHSISFRASFSSGKDVQNDISIPSKISGFLMMIVWACLEFQTNTDRLGSGEFLLLAVNATMDKANQTSFYAVVLLV